MDKDETFRRLMESAGVVPLDPAERPPAADRARPADKANPAGRARPAEKAGRRRSQRPEAAVDEADRLLFEAAMRNLDTAPLDTAPLEDLPADGAAPAAARAPRRIRPRKKDLRVDERVDLHGCTAEQAEKLLERALPAAAREQSRTLLVITGKGYHSPGGVPVLRRRVEEWIRRHGRSNGISAYSEAPRARGGRGAFVLYLESGSRS